MRPFEERLAKRARGRTPSIIRELLRFAAMPGMISLGGGYPNPDTFIFSSLTIAFRGEGGSVRLEGPQLSAASQYGPSRADPVLERLLADWHQAKGGPRPGENGLCVLNGSQEGLFIVAYLLLDEGDEVAVSEPTYPGAISAFSSFKARYMQVPLDSNGMNVDVLREELIDRQRDGRPVPKFVYVIPNGHNPGGVSLSVERRRKLLETAEEFDMLVVEDDPYELIRYDDGAPESLQSMDRDGRVIRLDSFSKIFVPGLRIGYVTAAPAVVRQFELFKQSANLHTSSFNQRILAAYLDQVGPEALKRHIAQSCSLYRRNRDALVAAAREFLPGDVEYTVPDSGLFVWFRLPAGIDAGGLHERFTESHKVLLVPGYGFSTGGSCRDCMRASFSTVRPDELREGIRRFAAMLESARK